MNAQPQDSPQLELPLASWTEDAALRTKNGARLTRWGSVEQACAILDGCDRQVIYDLAKTKEIRAYKRRPERPNSHWRVDLLSVWGHKQKQMRAL